MIACPAKPYPSCIRMLVGRVVGPVEIIKLARSFFNYTDCVSFRVQATIMIIISEHSVLHITIITVNHSERILKTEEIKVFKIQ